MRRLNSGAHIDRADPADNDVTGRHGQLRKNRRQMLNVKKHLDQIKLQGARPQHGHPLGIEILENNRTRKSRPLEFTNRFPRTRIDVSSPNVEAVVVMSTMSARMA